jgi:uncharacterized membrane protein
VLEAVANRRPASPARGRNVGGAERAGTLATGVALLAFALRPPLRRPWMATGVAGLVGGALLYRGARGRSRMWEALGVSTVRPGRVERTITINRSAAELHRAWRRPEVRARVMRGADDIDFVTDSAEEMMEWRARDQGHTGHLRFQRGRGDRGTEVRLALDGATASAADELLRRFKQLMETGEIPTTVGQPAGRQG